MILTVNSDYFLKQSSEMRFLRSVAGYRKIDKKRNTDIRQNLKIFNLGQKIREYQQNYFEHILRMSTYRIPLNIFNYHPKGRRDRCRPQMRWINSPNREIRTGQ
jgi:hypothetical protein